MDVLVVEDNPNDLALLESLLGTAKVRVVHAPSGERAIELLGHRDLAVIILDVNLGGQNGFETAKQIRAHPLHHETPIVFVSGYSKEDTDLAMGYELECIDYITKPLDPVVFRTKIHVLAELHRRQMLIERQSEFIQALFQGSPAGLAYVGRDLIVLRANREFCRLIGLREDAQGSRADELLSGPLGAGLLAALASGERTNVFAHPASGRTGPLGIHVDAVFEPFPGLDGQPEGVQISLVEGTERVERERLANERIRALEEADRMKDDFLSVLSHELRTPMNGLMGFGSILLEGLAGPLTDQQKKYLGRMQGCSDLLLSLVNDLLDSSRFKAGKVILHCREADLGMIARDVIAQLESLAMQRGQTVKLEVDDSAAQVVVDEERISQVLVNLLGNAIKFSPTGGTIVVRTSPEGRQVLLEVADNGVGVAPEDLPKLFKPFSQVDMSSTRRHGGLGLGLSIAKALIEAHGGAIGVESRQGEGCVFWFRVPANGPDDPTPPASGQHGTISKV